MEELIGCPESQRAWIVSVSRALRRANEGRAEWRKTIKGFRYRYPTLITKTKAWRRWGTRHIPGLKSETWGTLSSWLSKSWGLRDPPHRGLREDSESADQILRVVWSRRFQIGKGEV